MVDHCVIDGLVLQLVIGVVGHRRHSEALVVPIGVGEVFQAVDVVGSEQETGDGVLLAVQLELVPDGQVIGLGEALGEHDLVIIHHVLALEDLIGVDLLVPFQNADGVVLLLHVHVTALFQGQVVFLLQVLPVCLLDGHEGGELGVLHVVPLGEVGHIAVQSRASGQDGQKEEDGDRRQNDGCQVEGQVVFEIMLISSIQFHHSTSSIGLTLFALTSLL